MRGGGELFPATWYAGDGVNGRDPPWDDTESGERVRRGGEYEISGRDVDISLLWVGGGGGIIACRCARLHWEFVGDY